MESANVASMDRRMEMIITKKRLNILYITYDGILDQLGSSQIMPYLYGIAKQKHNIYIISFEKPNKLSAADDNFRSSLSDLSITWYPLKFQSKLRLISKIYDLAAMYIKALIVTYQKNIDVVHVRGHTAGEAGYLIKLICKKYLIFDFRGLWADERVDKGGWKLERPLDSLQYKYFKYKEKILLQSCDELVVLTNKVIPELIRYTRIKKEKITVIPCCADYSLFKYADKSTAKIAKSYLNLSEKEIVLGYLGSVGRMYRADCYLSLLQRCQKDGINIKGLVITQESYEFNILIDAFKDKELRKIIKVISAKRDEIPLLIAAMNVLVAFIEPTYAKIASSPTKISEGLACGLPVICNEGIGDTTEIILNNKAGIVLKKLNYEYLDKAAKQIEELSRTKNERIRTSTEAILSLDKGISLYNKVYARIIEKINYKQR